MFSWRKLGKVFDPSDHPGHSWMKEFAQAPATLLYDDFVRVFFSCRPERDADGQYVSQTAYVDLDRKDPRKVIRVAEKPILELGATGAFDEFGIYPFSTIQRDDHLFALYGGWTRCESIPFTVSLGAAVSYDQGETFTKLGDGPLITWNLNDPSVVSGPKLRFFEGRYYLWYVAGTRWIATDSVPDAVFKIRMATSTDCLNWERDGQDVIANRIEADECQASPDVFWLNGSYHMYFCYKYSLNFRGNDRGYRIGYASSADLINWERDDAQAGIDVSEDGWDAMSVSYPHVFEMDGRHFMLYLGNDFGRRGFGIAQMENSATPKGDAR